MNNNYKNLMPLKELAKTVGLAKSTLQYYKLTGRIKPVMSFPESKIQIYDLEQVKVALKK